MIWIAIGGLALAGLVAAALAERRAAGGSAGFPASRGKARRAKRDRL